MATQQNTATTSTAATFVSRSAGRMRRAIFNSYAAVGVSDEESDELEKEGWRVAYGMAQGHAITPREVLEKLRVLCDRIRTHLDIEYPGPVLDYLLAEGARSDLEAWILRAEDADADRLLFEEIARLDAIRNEFDNARGQEIEKLAKLASDTEQGIVERAAHTPAGVLWKARRLSQLLDDHDDVTDFMRQIAAAVVDGLADLDQHHTPETAERRAAQ